MFWDGTRYDQLQACTEYTTLMMIVDHHYYGRFHPIVRVGICTITDAIELANVSALAAGARACQTKDWIQVYISIITGDISGRNVELIRILHVMYHVTIVHTRGVYTYTRGHPRQNTEAKQVAELQNDRERSGLIKGGSYQVPFSLRNAD